MLPLIAAWLPLGATGSISESEVTVYASESRVEEVSAQGSANRGTVPGGQPRAAIPSAQSAARSLLCLGVQAGFDVAYPGRTACPTTPADPNDPAAPAAQQIIITIQDLEALGIDPGVMTVQPPADTVLINMETIVYTTAEEQIHTTDLAGIPLQIRATPTNFHWDFGDGTAFDTKKKGAPYPNHYLWHKYTEPTRDGPMRRITLTTTWSGSFSVDNGPWQTIDGTTTTTQTSHEFHVIELRSRIIENP